MILRAKGTVIIKMNITVFIITLSIDAGLTERAVARLPNHLAADVGQCLRGAQVIDVDLVGLS